MLSRSAAIFRYEISAEWSRTASALRALAVLSLSKHSIDGVSPVSVSSSWRSLHTNPRTAHTLTDTADRMRRCDTEVALRPRRVNPTGLHYGDEHPFFARLRLSGPVLTETGGPLAKCWRRRSWRRSVPLVYRRGPHQGQSGPRRKRTVQRRSP